MLLTNAQLGDNRAVPLDVLLGQVVQQLAAFADHLIQAAAAVVVVDVHPQVLGELLDAGGENGDLHLGGAGVGLVGAVGLDNRGLLVLADHGKFHLSCFFALPLGDGRAEAPRETRRCPKTKPAGAPPGETFWQSIS